MACGEGWVKGLGYCAGSFGRVCAAETEGLVFEQPERRIAKSIIEEVTSEAPPQSKKIPL